MKNENFNTKRLKTIKNFCRFVLGLQQLFYRPILNIIWFIFPFTVWFICEIKNMFMTLTGIPIILKSVLIIALNILLFIIPLLIVIFVINSIAEMTARSDEADLIMSFNAKELRNGNPKLIYKNKSYKNQITKRKYYSNIPLYIWQERSKDIADIMNVNIIDIYYGGKNKDNSKIIVLESTNGRKPADRGVLYEEEF